LAWQALPKMASQTTILTLPDLRTGYYISGTNSNELGTIENSAVVVPHPRLQEDRVMFSEKEFELKFRAIIPSSPPCTR